MSDDEERPAKGVIIGTKSIFKDTEEESPAKGLTIGIKMVFKDVPDEVDKKKKNEDK